MGQQLLARMNGHRSALVPWALFLGLGVLAATSVVALRPVIEAVFSYRFVPAVVLYIIALSVPVKFGNYALAAAVIAEGRLREKIATSLAVGALTVLLTVVAAVQVGAMGAASALVAGELFLAGGLSAILIRSDASVRDRRHRWTTRRTP
jgi:O-antigen/teichoic acid export membrane protein